MTWLDFIEKSVNTCFSLCPTTRPPKELIDRVKLVAHRGAHDYQAGILENTDAAFYRALLLQCAGIELDIHATRDAVLMVNHDPNLKRLWKIDEKISALSFQELRKKAPDIPTLAEVVEKYGRKMHLFIELKAPFNAMSSLAETLQTLTPCQDYHLISLDERQLRNLTAFDPTSILLVANYYNTKQFCDLSLNRKYGGVLGHYLFLNKKRIEALHRKSQIVGVGFVDSKYSMYREVKRGLEWMFTNTAETMSCILSHHKQAE